MPSTFTVVATCTVAAATGLLIGGAVAVAALIPTLGDETAPTPKPVTHVTVTAPPETVIEYRDRVVTNRVEVPVEVPVIEYVDRVVEVPVTDQAALDAAYVDGYVDGHDTGVIDGHDDSYMEGWMGGVFARDAELTELWGTAVVTPCATEDSTNCYWDATLMGNGEGTSFVNVEGALYFR